MKTKPKFSQGQKVQTGIATGRITHVLEFHDHAEYLVQLADGTSNWRHEILLTAVEKVGRDTPCAPPTQF